MFGVLTIALVVAGAVFVLSRRKRSGGPIGAFRSSRDGGAPYVPVFGDAGHTDPHGNGETDAGDGGGGDGGGGE